ncbi:hypothetical protein TGVAND_265030 [Toxoplasma gondii VAND]|uniref:Transmembrane protein n=1 Tax=Toxoplasma gondii VAND TaxID=933077 RepID=A0A086PM37_TOXGO|nr:hypothetical protein TGVAND_265030 [Toxoplasma gondii VAND]
MFPLMDIMCLLHGYMHFLHFSLLLFTDAVHAAAPLSLVVPEETAASSKASLAEKGEELSVVHETPTSILESLPAENTSTNRLPDVHDMTVENTELTKRASDEAPDYQDLSLSQDEDLLDRKKTTLQTGKAQQPRLRGHAPQAGKVPGKKVFSRTNKLTDSPDEKEVTHKKERKRGHTSKSRFDKGHNVRPEDGDRVKLSALSHDVKVSDVNPLVRKRRYSDNKLISFRKQQPKATQGTPDNKVHHPGARTKTRFAQRRPRGKEDAVERSKVSATPVLEEQNLSSDAEATTEHKITAPMGNSAQTSASVDEGDRVLKKEETDDIEFLMKKAVRGAALNAVIIQYLVDEARKKDTDAEGLLEQQINNLNALAVKFMRFNKDMKEAVEKARDNSELQNQLVNYWLNHLVAQQLVIFKTFDPSTLNVEPKLTQSIQPLSLEKDLSLSSPN